MTNNNIHQLKRRFVVIDTGLKLTQREDALVLSRGTTEIALTDDQASELASHIDFFCYAGELAGPSDSRRDIPISYEPWYGLAEVWEHLYYSGVFDNLLELQDSRLLTFILRFLDSCRREVPDANTFADCIFDAPQVVPSIFSVQRYVDLFANRKSSIEHEEFETHSHDTEIEENLLEDYMNDYDGFIVWREEVRTLFSKVFP